MTVTSHDFQSVGCSGFDVAICRAVAAAVLGDDEAVTFIPTTTAIRFTALAADFAGINYYDRQGFVVPVDLGGGLGP